MAKTIHEMFESILDEAYRAKMNELLAEMLTQKFSEEGIRVGKRTIKQIASQLQQGSTHFEFDKRRNADLKITIKASEIRKVLSEMRKWLRRNKSEIYNVLRKSVDAAADFAIKNMKRQMPEQIKAIQSERMRFESRIQKTWSKPLELLELYISCVQEITIECYNDQMESNEPNDIVFEVLFRLQARAIQIAKEVLVLLKAGFPDGAHARWRSLHELSVVAMFIEKHGQPVAERYLAHDAIEYCKGAEQFQDYAKALGQKKIPKRAMTKIRKQRDDALAAYEPNFRHEYGWAARALKPSSPKFEPKFVHLELDVKQEPFRPYYRKASWNIHAGASGITTRLGLLDEHQLDLILIGASEYGFTDPSHGAAVSLMKSTSAILSHNHEANIDRQLRAMVLLKMAGMIGYEFLRVQERQESN